jgi:hypothetical protein
MAKQEDTTPKSAAEETEQTAQTESSESQSKSTTKKSSKKSSDEKTFEAIVEVKKLAYDVFFNRKRTEDKVDRLKKVFRDIYGHTKGDHALKGVLGEREDVCGNCGNASFIEPARYLLKDTNKWIVNNGYYAEWRDILEDHKAA